MSSMKRGKKVRKRKSGGEGKEFLERGAVN